MKSVFHKLLMGLLMTTGIVLGSIIWFVASVARDVFFLICVLVPVGYAIVSWEALLDRDPLVVGACLLPVFYLYWQSRRYKPRPIEPKLSRRQTNSCDQYRRIYKRRRPWIVDHGPTLVLVGIIGMILIIFNIPGE